MTQSQQYNGNTDEVIEVSLSKPLNYNRIIAATVMVAVLFYLIKK